MASTGFLQVRAYVSNAQIPLRDVAIAITAVDGTTIALRLTDRNGMIRPIEIPVPEKAESQHPGADDTPFTTVNLYAYQKGYEQVKSTGIQIFADTTTYQALEMVPLAELPNAGDLTEDFYTPPQDL